MTEPLPPTPPPTRASATVSAANRYWCAAVLGVLTVVTMAIPTDVIDTPWFGRELPVRWWEYPTLVAVGILTTLWFAVAAPWRGSGTAVGGVTGLPCVFRTADFASIYAASCEFMYSMRTSCGVR